MIYGDTDSIMINTNLLDYDSVIKLGNLLKMEIKKNYKYLEVNIDGVFKSLLLLRKKKYAALSFNQGSFKLEIKGLDLVRRDWCELAKRTGEKVLFTLLTSENFSETLLNIQNLIKETITNIKNLDFKLFEISKVRFNLSK